MRGRYVSPCQFDLAHRNVHPDDIEDLREGNGKRDSGAAILCPEPVLEAEHGYQEDLAIG